VVDVQMDGRSRGLTRGQVRDTIAALRRGESVGWFGDARRLHDAAATVGAAVPEVKCWRLPLGDARGHRAFVWFTGDEVPTFARFTHRPVG
jgi:hypothetical protein